MQLGIVANTRHMCRICMAPEVDQPADLYDASQSGLPSLNEMLSAICAPVFAKSDDVMPEMPTKVCLTCRNAVVAAYNLHQQCIETDRRLGELVALMWELEGPGGDEVVESKDLVMTKVTLSVSDKDQNKIPKQSSAKKLPYDETVCSYCGKSFSTRWTLHRHKKYGWCDMSHDPKDRTCYTCNEVFNTVQLLKRHRQTHGCTDAAMQATEAGNRRRKTEENIECTDCGISFLSARAHRKHVEEGKCQLEKKFPCNLCGKIFDTESRRQYHMRNHKERVTCPNCHITYMNKGVLRLHLKRKRCTGLSKAEFEGPISCENMNTPVDQCNICGAAFSSHRAYRDHMQQGDCKRKPTFPCKICGKVFDRLSRMHYHLYMHKERVPCPGCDETFRSINSLRKHIQRKKCVDNKGSGSKNVYQAHFEVQIKNRDSSVEQQIHAEGNDESLLTEMQPSEEDTTDTSVMSKTDKMHIQKKNYQHKQIFPCTICGKVFYKISSMRFHRRTHQERVTCSTVENKAEIQMQIEREQCPGKDFSNLQNVSQGDLKIQIKQETELQITDGDATEVTNLYDEQTRTLEEDNCEPNQTFPCPICGEIFTKLTRMRYHKRNHKEPVNCSLCKQTFKNRASLHVHKRFKRCFKVVTFQDLSQGKPEIQPNATEDTSPGEKLCADCGATFTSSRTLLMHTKEGNCQRKIFYPCTICGKIFDKLSRMRYHRRNHTDTPERIR